MHGGKMGKRRTHGVSKYLEERSAEERRPEWVEGEAEECVGHLRLQE